MKIEPKTILQVAVGRREQGSGLSASSRRGPSTGPSSAILVIKGVF